MSENTPPSSRRWPSGSNRALLHVPAVLVLHALVLLAVGVPLARLLLRGEKVWAAHPMSFLFLVVVGSLDLLVSIRLGLMKWGRLRLAEIGWSRLVPARDLALGLLGGAAAIGLVFASMALFLGVPVTAQLLRKLGSFRPEQRVLFVLMGVYAAFAEETIFRGYLQPGLQRRLGRVGGLLAGAVLFSIYHLKFRPLALVSKALVGLVLGGLRDRTGSVWASAIAHALIWIVMGTL
jgi:membrane protease YdiL (CAAX protease family)